MRNFGLTACPFSPLLRLRRRTGRVLAGLLLGGSGLLVPRLRAEDDRRPQDITFPEVPEHLATDAPFDVDPSVSSGLPLTVQVVSGPATIEGRTVHLIGSPGVVILRASQEGTPRFRPAAAERAFSVRRPPAAPTMLLQPQDHAAGLGESVTFLAEAAGLPLPTYQWRKNGLPIAGATDHSLLLSSVGPADAGAYDVVATNANGSVTSNRAVLTLGKRAQTITFQMTSPNNPAGQSVFLNAFASSGLPVTYTVVAGAGNVSGNILMSTVAGSITVQATQAGDTSFAAASPVEQTFFFTASSNNSNPTGPPRP